MSEWRADPITGRWTVMADDLPLARRDFVVNGVTQPLDQPCPLCEGKELTAGREILAIRNGTPPDEPGWLLRVVPNRVPALRVEAGDETVHDGRWVHRPGLGAHEVVVESPRHDASWYTMNADELARVLGAWRARIADLRRDTRLKAVVAFKNHGAEAGARLVHAHSQVVAMPLVPPRLTAEVEASARHHAATGRCLHCDIIADERSAGLRVVFDTPTAVVVAPYASPWPFAVWVVPTRHGASFDAATADDLAGVAHALHDALQRLDRELERPAFNAMLRTVPYDRAAETTFHWYIELVPRIVRASGLDLGAGVAVNPVPPEKAARVLRGAR
jgi:UDPglucose--hexose-1-phosphate uridylyltransferase